MHRNLVLGLAAMALLVGGCAGSRRLDPAFTKESYQAVMKYHFELGVTDPGIITRVRPGDIIAFSTNDPSSHSSNMLGISFSPVSHIAIVFSKELLVLTADSERGVYIDSLVNIIQGRNFWVFEFPPGLLDIPRLVEFANRAQFLGRLSYRWMAIIGLNPDVTPNTLQDVSDGYTCSTVVAAALHFAGLSLDRAYSGIITPGDIIFSEARRNLNGPAARDRRIRTEGETGKEDDAWGAQH
jgi:hypothetical protein